MKLGDKVQVVLPGFEDRPLRGILGGISIDHICQMLIVVTDEPFHPADYGVILQHLPPLTDGRVDANGLWRALTIHGSYVHPLA